jgi:hypothetical protein
MLHEAVGTFKKEYVCDGEIWFYAVIVIYSGIFYDAFEVSCAFYWLFLFGVIDFEGIQWNMVERVWGRDLHFLPGRIFLEFWIVVEMNN